ncbi:DUF411 domain-containing protein [Craterilacuibacter sinensis]|uniref:DUF411 domain-containing protein n=1 Tax=Craterilacuibacter sinensis TaxID=2686017 RepID=UPI002E29A8A9|nr:DUF411 domain-containing protein [Craterilacuibacter sinensis]
MKHQHFIVAALAAVFSLPALAAPAGVMLKDPYCGCCDAWAGHMKQNGLEVTSRIEQNMAKIKDERRVPANLRSCHTAEIGGYLFEGHVPADLVKKVLKDKPKIAGLAVPGMPMGSPGMEGPSKQAYQVVAFDRQGKTYVYANR